jgi:hypothetical protein
MSKPVVPNLPQRPASMVHKVQGGVSSANLQGAVNSGGQQPVLLKKGFSSANVATALNGGAAPAAPSAPAPAPPTPSTSKPSKT